MTCDIFNLFAKRHSFYELNNNLPVQENDIVTIIQKCLEFYPSSFNTQSSRILLLLGAKHHQFWHMVQQELLHTAPADKSEAIKKRISSFVQGYGTILYFIDTEITENMEKQMPLYADNFKNWDIQGSAILQYMIWNAFANIEVGANLQHYNPLINKSVQQMFDLPQKWELIAQMPFGGIGQMPEPHIVHKVPNKLIIKE